MADYDEMQERALDTEGVLTASCVGAAEFGNLRVAFGFLEDGMTADVEIRDPGILEGV